MIVVDTSVWIDHLRRGNPRLVALLEDDLVLAHPWVTGELALGRLERRREVLGLLGNLQQAVVATAAEVLVLIENHEMFGLGIGYVDAQLLAASRLTATARLWTNDKGLAAAARRLGIDYQPDGAGA